MSSNTTAQDLLTKSSYCRNRKHSKCNVAACECSCHQDNTTVPSGTLDEIIDNIDTVQAEADRLQAEQTAELEAAVEARKNDAPEVTTLLTDASDSQLQEQIAYHRDRGDTDSANHVIAELGARERISAVHAETVAAADPLQVAAVRDQVELETGCGGCDNGEDCGAGCTDAAKAAARKLVIDRLLHAPAAPATPVKAPKTPKAAKPKGTVAGKLSNGQKRVIRVQMARHLEAMVADLSGELEGVTAQEVAEYVDFAWTKYIDPDRERGKVGK